MLREIDPQEMDERLAAEILDSEWKERLLTILKLGFMAICNVRGADFSPDDFDPLRYRAPSHRRFGHATQSEEAASPNAAAAIAAMSLGPPTNKR